MSEVILKPGWLKRDVARAAARLKTIQAPSEDICTRCGKVVERTKGAET